MRAIEKEERSRKLKRLERTTERIKARLGKAEAVPSAPAYYIYIYNIYWNTHAFIIKHVSNMYKYVYMFQLESFQIPFLFPLCCNVEILH